MMLTRLASTAALAISFVAALAGTASAEPGSLRFPDASLQPSDWSQLDGWTGDDHAAAYATFRASCRAILPQKPKSAARRFIDAMKTVCRRGLATAPANTAEARAFFEANFLPIRIAKVGEEQGFLTGYYEPIVAGSRFPTPEYTVPLHRRPGDLFMAGGKRKKAGAFANKGKVYRRVGKKSVLYYDRAEIEDGALDGRQLEICWLKDPIDAFFIHIQGSARIQLEDGAMLRVNYDAHNGHRYLPVGRVLIDRGEVSKEEMSMDRIRQWMLANPDGGRELRRMNKSYVFFRVVKLSDQDEPIGAQGVQLTPGRSIAIDRHLHLYGTLFWIEADLPIASESPDTKFRRLMVGQDTGSAIIGPARADIYFGAGDEAGRIGGRIKQPGRFVMLVPREIDPFEKWRNVPMPPVRGEAREVAEARDPIAVATTGPAPLPKPAPKKAAKMNGAKKMAARESEPRPARRAAAKPDAKTSATPAAKPAPKPAQKKPAKTAKPAEKEQPSALSRLLGFSKPDPKPAAAKKKKASGKSS
jgi:membrane-bound lytic murein transglycosylase A